MPIMKSDDLAESVSTVATWRESFRRMARHHWTMAALFAAASLAVSIGISCARWPVPQVHDEFANLLAADTFFEGRLANQPHRHWQHFETFHVILQPAYASKYPPGQGAVFAFGQSLTGEPIVGLWLLTALTVVACYWMLLGWTSPRWALLGGLLVVIHPGYHLVWGQIYWGGTLAMLGGSLVLGAALRIVRRTHASDAFAMSTGAIILAASRPFEGFVFCLFIGAWVLVRWMHAGIPSPWIALLLKTVAPQATILLVGGIGLARYNQAVTDDPLKLPYAIHEATYGQAPLFHGQAPATRSYRHEVMERFHSGWAMDWYRRQQSLAGFLKTKWQATRAAANFFVPPLLCLPLLMLALRPRLWARGRFAAPLAIGALTFLASLSCLWNFPHYLAPLAPTLLIATVAGIRYFDVTGRRRFGPWPYAEALIALQACLFTAQAIDRAVTPVGGWHLQRSKILANLENSPDRHLVFVRYEPRHNTHQEWVYNRADIDHAKVVWARAIDPASDRALMDYFDDRKVWLLEPDLQRMTLVDRDSITLASDATPRAAAPQMPHSRPAYQSRASHAR
jgi:hypothetical protein